MVSVRVAVSFLLILAITMIGISIFTPPSSPSLTRTNIKTTVHVHRTQAPPRFKGAADITLEPTPSASNENENEEMKQAINQIDQAELLAAHHRTSAKPVKVDFFVMSQCPDAQFCENVWGPVLAPLSSIIDVDMNYIATDSGRGTFKCMHGNAECTGNIQQLCAHNVTSDLSWFDFATCQSQSRTSIPGNAQGCAERTGINYELIQHCVEGQLGKDLFSSSISKTNAAGAKKSCTLQLNGATWCIHDGTWKQCNEGTSADELTRAICSRYEGTSKPQPCH